MARPPGKAPERLTLAPMATWLVKPESDPFSISMPSHAPPTPSTTAIRARSTMPLEPVARDEIHLFHEFGAVRPLYPRKAKQHALLQ